MNALSDWHLTSDTASYLSGGIILNAPFNVDPDGITRGANGTWDRGAYEFTTGSTGSIAPPQNLAIASIQ
jgi:hypothetical protein